VLAAAARAQEAAAAAAEPVAQAAAAVAAPAQQTAADLPKRIAALEREARKSDPTLALKLKDLETQRRQLFIQAKPELEALYAAQDAVGGKAQTVGGKPGAGKAKPRQGAADKAERQAAKAAKTKTQP